MMTDSTSQQGSTSASIHWPSLFQFGLSGLAVLVIWGIAFFMLLGGLNQFMQGVSLGRIDPSGFLMAGGFALIGGLLFPSAWFALMRLIRRPVRSSRGGRWKNAGFVIWWMIPVVLAGYGVAVTPEIAWLLLPPLNVLALSIPVVWYLSLGGRGLNGPSAQSAWGIFGAGLALGPVFILLLELIAGVLGIIVLGAWLSQEPGFLQEIERIAQVLRFSSSPDPTILLPLAEKYLMRPSVLGGGLLYIAGFVPLLEELLKPIGLLFLNKGTLTPARGFLAGMLSGAAFGLFENLLQAVSGPEWVILALGRTGTSLIHIFNSGLVGWGFALAWQTRRPWPFLARYLVAVAIHALWNGTTVMVGVASLPDQDLVSPAWGITGTGVLVFLAGVAFLSLISINRRLQREQATLTGSAPLTEQRESPPLEPGGAPLAGQLHEAPAPDETSDFR